mgnify:FL=1
MVESVLNYGSEIWIPNENMRQRVTHLQRIPNEEIRYRMKANETVLERIERRELKWFGHLTRMPDDRWPKRLFKWVPPGRRKRGRPRRSWNDGMREAMERRNLDMDMAQDRQL